jgi:hypothetical protein
VKHFGLAQFNMSLGPLHEQKRGHRIVLGGAKRWRRLRPEEPANAEHKYTDPAKAQNDPHLEIHVVPPQRVGIELAHACLGPEALKERQSRKPFS